MTHLILRMKELHGGPFGPGTLNPYSPNQPMNFAGHWPGVKNPVQSRALPSAVPMNYNPTFSGGHSAAVTSFLQIKSQIATKVTPRGACAYMYAHNIVKAIQTKKVSVVHLAQIHIMQNPI